MKAEEFLLAVAQIGLTLAGITGIVALLRRADQHWVFQDVAGLKIILELSFASVFFALLPFPLHYMSVAEDKLWRISNLLLGCFWLAYLFLLHYRVVKMRRSNAPPRRPKVIWVSTLITLLLVVTLIFNPFSLNATSAYLWGMIWLLAVPGQQLFFFISFFTSSLFEEKK